MTIGIIIGVQNKDLRLSRVDHPLYPSQVSLFAPTSIIWETVL